MITPPPPMMPGPSMPVSQGAPTLDDLAMMEPGAMAEALSMLDPLVLTNIVAAATEVLKGEEQAESTGTEEMAEESPASLV